MLEKTFANKVVIPQLRKVFSYVFPIETEETVKGFPDLLCETASAHAVHIELKIADEKGIALFKPSQIPFYKSHTEMIILILIGSSDGKRIFPLRLDEIYARMKQVPKGFSVQAGLKGEQYVAPSQLSSYIRKEIYGGSH